MIKLKNKDKDKSTEQLNKEINRNYNIMMILYIIDGILWIFSDTYRFS